jgi:transcription antitermination factor NusG
MGEALHQIRESVDATSSVLPSTLLPVEGSAYWYAVCIAPRHEKRVAAFLTQRQIENFVPLYRTVHRWKNGCKAQLELPLFPGYLFVKIAKKRRVQVLEVPGVIAMVGTRTGPVALSEDEIETLRSGLHLQKVEPFRELAVGQPVRIVRGALAGLSGVLVRSASGFRVVLTVELIHQSVVVEVEGCDIEPTEVSQPSSLVPRGPS